MLFIGCCSGFLSYSSAQDIAITTELTPSAIQIGEYAQIKMTIRTNDLENTLLVIAEKRQMGQMIITSFADGLVELPAFGATVGEVSYFSKPLYLKVTMPEVDTTQPLRYNPIKAPLAVSLRWWEYLLLVLMKPVTWVILGVVLLGGSILWYRHYRRNLPEPKRDVIPLTALETFDQTIASLRLLPFANQEEQIAYYDGLIAALRIYLTEGLGLDIDGLTARELARMLQRKPYGADASRLEIWVQHSEWIRFADAWAYPEWQVEDATNIYEIVHHLDDRKEGESL